MDPDASMVMVMVMGAGRVREQPIEQELGGGVEWGSRMPREPSQPANAGI